MYMWNDFLIMLMHHYHEQYHHHLVRQKQNFSINKRENKILGWVDPFRAASLRAAGIEFGCLPFDERAGSSNSGTVSIADQSISAS